MDGVSGGEAPAGDRGGLFAFRGRGARASALGFSVEAISISWVTSI